jgi:hypothetical protein
MNQLFVFPSEAPKQDGRMIPLICGKETLFGLEKSNHGLVFNPGFLFQALPFLFHSLTNQVIHIVGVDLNQTSVRFRKLNHRNSAHQIHLSFIR